MMFAFATSRGGRLEAIKFRNHSSDAFCTQVFADAQRWSEEKANGWYQQQPWLVGSNFIPATAINELEMWQAATFDPQRSTRNWVGPKAWA